MRSLMRIARGILSSGAGRWPSVFRAVPWPHRCPATPRQLPSVSDTAPRDGPSQRAPRSKRTTLIRNLSQESLPETQLSEGTVASAQIDAQPAASAAAPSPAASSPAPKAKSRKRTAFKATAFSSSSSDLPGAPPDPHATSEPLVQPSGAATEAIVAPAQAPVTKPRTRRTKAKPVTAVEPSPLAPGTTKSSIAAGRSAAKKAAAAAAEKSLTEPQLQPQLATTARPAASTGVLLVVDGNYLANRSYYGYGRMRLTASNGVPTTVTYGVLKTLQAAIRAVQPTALAVVFDPPGPTFRSVMSLLDPRGPAGAQAARLVQRGELDWQGLANRLLSLARVQSDILEAAGAEAAATPMSYMHPSGSFFGPLPVDTATASEAAAAFTASIDPGSLPTTAAAPAAPSRLQRPPSAVRHAAAVQEVLLEALGPELVSALGLLPEPTAAAAGSDAEGAAALVAVQLLPLYKAGRTPPGEDFYADFQNLQRLLGLMSVPPVCRPWLEADDVAGLLVQQAVQKGMAVRIVSGDRDLMQLVNDRDDVAMLYPNRTATPSPQKGATAAAGGASRRRAGDFPFDELREADVVSALGVAPGLVPDFKALTGDVSDHLPGISGIGPKTAVQLLATYGSLTGIHQAAGELTPKRRAALQAEWPAAQYTLALARVLGSKGAPSVPSDVLSSGLLDRLALRGFDSPLVERALLELDMKSLARGSGRGGELWRDFMGRSEREEGTR